MSQASTTHDALLAYKIDSARERIEQDLDRTLITTTWEHRLFGFPCAGQPIDLHKKPLQSVASVIYRDPDDVPITLDAADYDVDLGHRAIFYTADSTWPSTSKGNRAVTVTYVAGYGDDDDSVPRNIQDMAAIYVKMSFFDEWDGPLMNSYQTLVNNELATFF